MRSDRLDYDLAGVWILSVALVATGIVPALSWSLWLGVPMMVLAVLNALTTFAMRRRAAGKR